MAKISLNTKKIDRIKEICTQYGNSQGEIINILHKVQSEFGFLPMEVQELISEEIRMPVAQIYGIISFYSFFSMKPKGKHPISICLGTACYVRDSEKVLEEFKRQLGVGLGELTSDGKFSLDTLRCVGACGLAPVALIGEKVYGRVTPNQVKEILSEYND